MHGEKLLILSCRIQIVNFLADSVMDELRINGGSRFTDEAYDELLALYGLETLKEVHPATLSGGQKQRLTLAVSDLIDYTDSDPR